MEIAEQIVVMSEGAVEQHGSPDEVYDRPANDFVMGFVGPVTRLGDRLVRPHDVEILGQASEGALEARITRIVRLGFEVRVELQLADGSPVHAQLTRAECEQLDIGEGQSVFVRALRAPAAAVA